MEYLIVSAMSWKQKIVPSHRSILMLFPKATLMAEWTKKKEFDRPSRKISDSNER